MSDYTKDEWLYESGCVVSSKGAVLLHAERGELLTRAVERDANVRLASAAPRLLEACEGALAALTQNKTFPADIDTARLFLRAAIAAAKGES